VTYTRRMEKKWY